MTDEELTLEFRNSQRHDVMMTQQNYQKLKTISISENRSLSEVVFFIIHDGIERIKGNFKSFPYSPLPKEDGVKSCRFYMTLAFEKYLRKKCLVYSVKPYVLIRFILEKYFESDEFGERYAEALKYQNARF